MIALKYANEGNLEAACVEVLKQIEEKKHGRTETVGHEANQEIWNCASREGMYGGDGIASLFIAA